ncbi:hypothetical protein NLB33_35235 [Mycolicibacterium smegmatis]|uniref:hypothetical protein n=1 Tax=Mycolicibacterium smegmatis TaxID=1772 RepID=UPI0020A2FDFD|nr:hypothetical protein [Mycolicibacterium smegmatis]MCP2628106.1 hypothetical protein [Mycolicibacterium smegmatis]
MTDLLPADAPEEVGVGYISGLFDVSRAAVVARIKNGDLPARVIPGSGRSFTYAIRPSDAALIWGHKLRKQRKATV